MTAMTGLFVFVMYCCYMGINVKKLVYIYLNGDMQ